MNMILKHARGKREKNGRRKENKTASILFDVRLRIHLLPCV